ncbi:MAG: c-type cytochrome [Candidatus Acidiferrum sp.]
MISISLRTRLRQFPSRCGIGVSLCLLSLTLVPLNHAQIAAAPKNPGSPQGSTNEGRQLFESVCAGCHGLDGRGGERGPDISTRQQIVQLSDADTLEILRAGRPAAGMPPFGSFGEAKLKQLLAYLRTLQGKGTVAALPGDPRNGRTLFFGKARCSDCHMMQGAGGFLGRDLSVYGAALSPAEVHTNILRPSEASNKANKTAVVVMRDSSKFSGVIRNEDNFSIQLQSTDGAFHFLNRSDVAQVTFLPEPIMPSDYDKTLTPSELNDLVSYLLTATKKDRPKNQPEDEE